MTLQLELLFLIFITQFFANILCVIPSFSVLKFDIKHIERQRKDTLEICKIFNEDFLKHNHNVKRSEYNIYNTTKKRIKRNIDNDQYETSVLNRKDIVRVENIVDNLYDDVQQREGKINYRRRILKNTSDYKEVNNENQRRFNFAPAELYGPSEDRKRDDKQLEARVPHIPWLKKWKFGIVPFFIDPNSYDSFLADSIIKAFDYFEKVACIRLQRLRERPTDKKSMQDVEWLYITNPSGVRQCVHSNERKPNSGVQMMVLGYDCLSQGEIVHEVMHILGFSHEHTRPDRDRYVTVVWNNIKSGYKKYFEVRETDPLSIVPYDYASILHYPPRAFSKNGQVTIVSESNTKIGQREALSELDLEKIEMIYGSECIERNKDYLKVTCPSVTKPDEKVKDVTTQEVNDYYNPKIWPYGIINYKIKNKLEFTTEEIENIQAVFTHIEKETCIEFRDISEKASDEQQNGRDNNNYENKFNDSETSTKVLERNVTKISHSDIDNEIPAEETEYVDDIASFEKNLKENNDKPNVTLLSFGTYNNFKNLSRRGRTKALTKRIRIHIPLSASRRHAADILELVRSTKAGCSCPSSGRPLANKILPINSDCFNSANDLLHLFVHVLGLDHQHNSHDRDSYLHVMWDKLTPEIKKEMSEKLPPAASAGFTYDYQSIMHYPWLQIKDGVTNIMYPTWNDGWVMGHWQGLSWTDVQKLNTIYREQCEKRQNETQS